MRNIKVSKEWNYGIILTIDKKGDKRNYDNSTEHNQHTDMTTILEKTIRN